MIVDQTDILTLTDAYKSATGVTDKTVSHRMFNDGKKLTAIRDGRVGMTVVRFNQSAVWFHRNWPDGCDWPLSIERPTEAEAQRVEAA